MRIEHTLEQIATRAVYAATGEDSPAHLKPTTDPKHGDYQINAAMALAKKLKRNPRDLAQSIATQLESEPSIAKAEVAGPGFVNLTLASSWIAEQVEQAARDVARDGVPLTDRPQKV